MLARGQTAAMMTARPAMKRTGRWPLPASQAALHVVKDLRSIMRQQRQVFYLGRQHHLIHAEGTSLRSDVQGLEDRQFASDALLYSKLWPAERVAAVMGIRHS